MEDLCLLSLLKSPSSLTFSPQCSMPSCIVAFHVTCAFDHGLEMKTILAENDEVRFKSFCLEHSCSTSSSSGVSNGDCVNGAHAAARPDTRHGVGDGLLTDQTRNPNGGADLEPRSTSHLVSVSASERAERDQLEREKVSQRKQKLQELEDEFYQFVDPGEVAGNLGLPISQVRHTKRRTPFIHFPVSLRGSTEALAPHTVPSSLHCASLVMKKNAINFNK